MSDHLSEPLLTALADGELSPEQMADVTGHLARCAACTSLALSEMMLKSATARAGQRYSVPAAMQARLSSSIAAHRPAVRMPWIGWAAAAAVLLLLVGSGVVQRRSTARTHERALTTEMLDQHVALLAVNAPLEVLSSDRHTVKPWFQGRLPFSFNLPDDLPADIALEGANLSYLDHRPVVHLLYTIGRHRVSVFLREATAPDAGIAVEQLGFHGISFRAGSLEGTAISDVDPKRLHELAAALHRAQTPDR